MSYALKTAKAASLPQMKKGMPLGQIVVPLDLPSQWRHPLVVVLIDHLNPRSLATGARDAQRKAAMFGIGCD